MNAVDAGRDREEEEEEELEEEEFKSKAVNQVGAERDRATRRRRRDLPNNSLSAALRPDELSTPLSQEEQEQETKKRGLNVGGEGGGRGFEQTH